MIRVGLGTDLHRLVEGRKLILGGVHIPFEKGEHGHSDGDVLLHAITDSLLGAAAISDIGELYPPSDDKWKNADSKELLKNAYKLVKNEGWSIENIDCVIKLEKPKFLPYRQAVRESIAGILEIEPSQVFVKAKTGEKLGDVGMGVSIEAEAVCLLSKKD
ncbi:MAG: 2-C-methyl-D-erythritol 2,4-cyclodiphosphate synthase [Spirochaetaceae bacterium]|nr:2-C-methyl-D-erythritol 2,4-cyclodiphosphate synthase [Spirochaetaceae bacterium]